MTFIAHFALKNMESVHKWFDKLQGIDEKVLSKYGEERMDLDREGKIVGKLMEGVTEPLTTPAAWPFLAFPFIAPFALPWWGYGIEVLEKVESVGGLPKWCFDFTIVNSFGTGALIIVCLFFWKGRPEESIISARKSSFGARKASASKTQVMPATTQVMPAKTIVGPTATSTVEPALPGQIAD